MPPKAALAALLAVIEQLDGQGALNRRSEHAARDKRREPAENHAYGHDSQSWSGEKKQVIFATRSPVPLKGHSIFLADLRDRGVSPFSICLLRRTRRSCLPTTPTGRC
jgi:hypothetical protein